LQELEAEFNRAKKVRAKRIPHDVITMDSTVCLEDLDSGEEMSYILVLPPEADIDQHKISNVSFNRMAMLGYQEGDTLDCQVPDGISRRWVKAIHIN
jgi:regulator of nucleoside diphosphate kinase